MMAIPGSEIPDEVLHLEEDEIHQQFVPLVQYNYQHLQNQGLQQNRGGSFLGSPRYPPQLQNRLSRGVQQPQYNLQELHQLKDDELHLDPLIQHIPGPMQLTHSLNSEIDTQYNGQLNAQLNTLLQINRQLGDMNSPQRQLNELLSRGPEAEDVAQILDAAKKVAPRSNDLFRVGPPFQPTTQHRAVYCGDTFERVKPVMSTRIDRGFEVGEHGNWIGYKRNYFTLVLTFHFDGWDFDRFLRSRFYIYDDKDGTERKVNISYFALSIVAKCLDPEVPIGLVQHTPKRDKGPQYSPPIYPAIPGELPDHHTVKASCNKRNGSKIQSMNRIFNFDRAEYYRDKGLDQYKDASVLKGYPSDQLVRVARFERIQFTGSIRVKATSIMHKYFTLNLELLGIVEDENHHIQPVLVASSQSAPLLIRGRSPSNYHKDKTSGYRGPLQGYS